jgi:endo-1,4-beta-D-glucanase Y
MSNPIAGLSRRALLTAASGLLPAAALAADRPGAGDEARQSAAPADRRAASAAARRPFPQHVTYAAGTIFPNHRSQARLDDDVRAAYDRWRKRYLVRVTDGKHPLYRVALGKPGTDRHKSTVSEGQGYGMVILALLAGYDPRAKKRFDGLWRYARKHRSCIDDRLMLWRIPNQGHGCDSATDGDLDIAYALLLADAQWGSGGAIDYAAAARKVLAGVLASTIGPQSRLTLLGDWVKPTGPKYNQWTPRTSDFMTGHFRAFRRATGQGVWEAVADACLDVVAALQAEFSPQTGLLPDFVQPKSGTNYAPRPADPGFLEGPHDGAYGYNAGRDPWRLGTDALVNGNAAAAAAAAKISSWAEEETDGHPQRLRAGYELNGAPLPGSNYFTTFFAAPIGVAAMTAPSQQAWLNALYDSVRTVREDYYEDTITLLALLVMTRSFWDPTG